MPRWSETPPTTLTGPERWTAVILGALIGGSLVALAVIRALS